MAKAMVMRTGPGHHPVERTISPAKLSAAATNAPENHRAARLRLSNRATARKTADWSRHKATMIQEMRTAPLIAFHPLGGPPGDRQPKSGCDHLPAISFGNPIGALAQAGLWQPFRQIVVDPQTNERGEMAMAQVLTDLADIRQWTEARGGNPIMADIPDV